MVDHVPRVLMEALALIDSDGWAQPGRHGWFGGTENCSPDAQGVFGYCAHTAILEIAACTRVGGRAVKVLSLTVEPAGRGTSIELVAWNDARGRTLSQVRAAFFAAIDGFANV